jgi:hypothetical protein
MNRRWQSMQEIGLGIGYLTPHRVSICIFYSRVYSIVRKEMFFMTKFKPFCYNLNLLSHASCNLVVHIVMNYLFIVLYKFIFHNDPVDFNSVR